MAAMGQVCVWWGGGERISERGSGRDEAGDEDEDQAQFVVLFDLPRNTYSP